MPPLPGSSYGYNQQRGNGFKASAHQILDVPGNSGAVPHAHSPYLPTPIGQQMRTMSNQQHQRNAAGLPVPTSTQQNTGRQLFGNDTMMQTAYRVGKQSSEQVDSYAMMTGGLRMSNA